MVQKKHISNRYWEILWVGIILSGNDVQIKLFQNPLSDPTALGDEIISPTTVTSVNDTTQPIHWTVSVDGDNNLVVTVNGITAQYDMKKILKVLIRVVTLGS